MSKEVDALMRNPDLKKRFESFDQATRANLVITVAYHKLNPDRFLLMQAHQTIYGFTGAQDKLKRNSGTYLACSDGLR